jgi:hypothetical protein
MTAEVAILNREAVAIAADSAATVSDQTGQKIFSSANKIFSLSKHHPVGIMIYGNAIFMGVPWETIIKMFRKKLGDKKYDSLFEYGKEFIDFLKNGEQLFPKEEQEKYVRGCAYGFFIEIRNAIIEQIEGEIEKEGSIEQSTIKEIASELVSNANKQWTTGLCIVEDTKVVIDELQNEYGDIFKKAISEVFEKIPLSTKSKNELNTIAAKLFICFPEGIMNSGLSGVVVSGFGEKEIFPSIASYSIEGIANNILKYREDRQNSIDYDNSAMIQPFAQMEMVRTFIDGISPLFQDLYHDLINETIESYPEIIVNALAGDSDEKEKDKAIKAIKKITKNNFKDGIDRISQIQFQHFVEPILKVVTFLPKNELAEMAESLVNLTCLRKKISMDDETVGGPIDVAVISKGDGLIWIRRKHYFDSELNRHFFMNYLNK